jgi:hypothetical protein
MMPRGTCRAVGDSISAPYWFAPAGWPGLKRSNRHGGVAEPEVARLKRKGVEAIIAADIEPAASREQNLEMVEAGHHVAGSAAIE